MKNQCSWHRVLSTSINIWQLKNQKLNLKIENGCSTCGCNIRQQCWNKHLYQRVLTSQKCVASVENSIIYLLYYKYLLT